MLDVEPSICSRHGSNPVRSRREMPNATLKGRLVEGNGIAVP